MADKRIKEYWSNEMEALLHTYTQFELLIPSEKNAGAAHVGEDGRFVEYLVREYLKKYLPKNLEVLTGFILRPAVGCGEKDKSRKKDQHEISSQLDIIIYDTAHFPVYQRFGDCVIVLPEGVAGIISVKKHLRLKDIEHEMKMLSNACTLCSHKNKSGKNAKSPFTALITIEDKIDEKSDLTVLQKGGKIFGKIKNYYDDKNPVYFNEMVDFVCSLSEWGLCKGDIDEKKEAKYYLYEFKGNNMAMGFQVILHNILNVYYTNTSSTIVRPGFTDNSNESYIKAFGPLIYDCKQINRRSKTRKKI